MDMNINVADFMTDEQRVEIGQAITAKLLAEIEKVQFAKTSKLNFVKMLNDDIRAAFDNGEIYDNLDFGVIGKMLTEKFKGAI